MNDPTVPAFDLLVTGATVVDGTGREGFRADVGVRDGYVIAVGELDRPGAARERYEAEGLVLAPGFVELHSHGAPDALREAESSLRQGVTTEILNPDGFGTEGAPWADIMGTPDITRTLAFAAEPPGIAINIGAYVGLGAVWAAGNGLADRRPDAEAVERMRKLVARALELGAWGVSAGLYYPPSSYGTTDEVVDVVSAARPWRVPFSNHVRNEGPAVREATEESLRIAERAGLVPVIAHMKAMGPANWGATADTVRAVAQARERGLRAAGEVYPYLSSRTGLAVLVPPAYRSGGDAAMLARFADPAVRPEVAAGIAGVLRDRVADARDVHLESTGGTLGQYCVDHATGAGEAVMRLLSEDPEAMAVYDFGHEADLERILRQPFVAVASDGGACLEERTHPRHYGTQPRVLARYVRDRHLLSLPQAVRRMTGLPASVLGMPDRGVIVPGAAADLVLFDPAEIRDLATFQEPRRYARGVRSVLVNGAFALRDGELTGAAAGRVLRRPSYAVSDPDTGTAAGGLLTVTGSFPGGTCEVEVRSTDGDGRAGGAGGAGGRLSVRTPEGRAFTSGSPGLVRTGGDWASVTGVGSYGDGGAVPFHLVVRTADPWHDGRPSVAWAPAGAPVAGGPLDGTVLVTVRE
ncbi:amidohydrolase family protein [Streptomyces sp. NPDC020807]|uniref:N-acyl-D-amino-acid deacylase family protein n=1 Tax=Streptomyces sp. NPDC020807 TaxID=3155119 RepID=UPI0033C3259C